MCENVLCVRVCVFVRENYVCVYVFMWVAASFSINLKKKCSKSVLCVL